jgi:hypothetical protein
MSAARAPGQGPPGWPPEQADMPAVKAVVDTNVIACLMLGTDRFVDEARGVIAALDEAWAPARWEAELANASWMAVRPGSLVGK